MDIFQIGIVLGVLAFFAHIIKGLTGFGPAIVFVSIGSMIHSPKEIIVLASLLDIIGGSYLIALNPQFLDNKKYWMPIGLLMVLGAITGGLILSIVPATAFKYILGFAIILISFWFLLGKTGENKNTQNSDKIGIKDGLVGAFSGFSGGLTGMGGPPLAAYLGTKFEKNLFRAIIVPIFLVSAIARFSTYGTQGMINTTNLWLYIFPPIGVLLGNHIGNHFFEDVKQKKFTILIGLILLLSGIRLIIT